jgi:hypothetical protein
MPASEAKIAANRQNSAKSTGPKTPEGKEVSRRNSFKHGLTGAGIVLPNEDVAEVEERLKSYREDLQPVGQVAEDLARRAAVLSVRLDRCVSHETASIAGRIRQAEADFVAPTGEDGATVAQLKAEAKARAMFDASKEATLARKYEAAIERGFFKALKELRQLAKESQAAQPVVDHESFRAMVASFDQFQAECDAFEAENFDEDLRTRPNYAKRAEVAPVLPPSAPVDVPITIGRRR